MKNLLLDPENFEKTVFGLGKKYKLIDLRLTRSILAKYEKIPTELKNLRFLTEKLKHAHPNLFSHDIVFGVNQVLDKKSQEVNKKKVFEAQFRYLDYLNTKEKMSKFLQDAQVEAHKIETRMLSLFPQDSFQHSLRIKGLESLLSAIKQKSVFPLGDVIGLRIIPKKSSLLPETAKKIEGTFGSELIYKTNNLAFSQKQLIKLKGYGSTYYNAIHYHLSAGKFFAEIQIRTPGINQWSKLAHYTVYKKRISVDSITSQYIMEFGRRASIVDYYEILNG